MKAMVNKKIQLILAPLLIIAGLTFFLFTRASEDQQNTSFNKAEIKEKLISLYKTFEYYKTESIFT